MRVGRIDSASMQCDIVAKVLSTRQSNLLQTEITTTVTEIDVLETEETDSRIKVGNKEVPSLAPADFQPATQEVKMGDGGGDDAVDTSKRRRTLPPQLTAPIGCRVRRQEFRKSRLKKKKRKGSLDS